MPRFYSSSIIALSCISTTLVSGCGRPEARISTHSSTQPQDVSNAYSQKQLEDLEEARLRNETMTLALVESESVENCAVAQSLITVKGIHIQADCVQPVTKLPIKIYAISNECSVAEMEKVSGEIMNARDRSIYDTFFPLSCSAGVAQLLQSKTALRIEYKGATNLSQMGFQIGLLLHSPKFSANDKPAERNIVDAKAAQGINKNLEEPSDSDEKIAIIDNTQVEALTPARQDDLILDFHAPKSSSMTDYYGNNWGSEPILWTGQRRYVPAPTQYDLEVHFGVYDSENMRFNDVSASGKLSRAGHNNVEFSLEGMAFVGPWENINPKTYTTQAFVPNQMKGLWKPLYRYLADWKTIVEDRAAVALTLFLTGKDNAGRTVNVGCTRLQVKMDGPKGRAKDAQGHPQAPDIVSYLRGKKIGLEEQDCKTTIWNHSRFALDLSAPIGGHPYTYKMHWPEGFSWRFEDKPELAAYFMPRGVIDIERQGAAKASESSFYQLSGFRK